MGYRSGQDYALNFFFRFLDDLDSQPSWYLQYVLSERLKAGDIRFKQALDRCSLWKDELWGDKVKAVLKAFQPGETAAAGDLDDDIPF